MRDQRNLSALPLRDLRQFIPDGFRDEDGVWHDGPHRIAFDQAVERLEKYEEALRMIRSHAAAGFGGEVLVDPPGQYLDEFIDGVLG